MLVIEHLDGRSPADDYVLQLLERWGLLDRRAVWAAIAEEEARVAEAAVELREGEAEQLMRPAGPRGGRLPR